MGFGLGVGVGVGVRVRVGVRFSAAAVTPSLTSPFVAAAPGVRRTVSLAKVVLAQLRLTLATIRHYGHVCRA